MTKRPAVTEVNFDAIVGPTHNYAGLANGNLASARNRDRPSNPQAAALEGLTKMAMLMELGVAQAVIPPQERPHIATLRQVGFTGSDTAILARAAAESPELLAACSSASSMWAANAATVAPSPDADDGRLHITPANLASHLHRAIEPAQTHRFFATLFHDESRFAVHQPLPAVTCFGDEGAANHTRLTPSHDLPGIHLFAYGRTATHAAMPGMQAFPARQTLEASKVIARLHRLSPDRCLYFQQHPVAIDVGVFHNDVIAVGNENVLLFHANAYVGAREQLDSLEAMFAEHSARPLKLIAITADELSLEDAVATYLFNSQLITLPASDHRMALIYPCECADSDRAMAVIDHLIAGDNPIIEARPATVSQSMRNGGGPACLRLRVPMHDTELDAIERVRLTPDLLQQLVQWVTTHYRQRLTLEDLHDPALLQESRDALDALSRLLKMEGLFEFQR